MLRQIGTRKTWMIASEAVLENVMRMFCLDSQIGGARKSLPNSGPQPCDAAQPYFKEPEIDNSHFCNNYRWGGMIY
jgi:hypothetical protein